MDGKYWSIWSAVGLVSAGAGLLIGLASIAVGNGTEASAAAVVIAPLAIGMIVFAIIRRRTTRKNSGGSEDSR